MTGPAPTTLDGGKAIAAYVGRDVRTIRRWIKSAGFPVFRLQGRLVADTRRIDLWRETSQVHASARKASA